MSKHTSSFAAVVGVLLALICVGLGADCWIPPDPGQITSVKVTAGPTWVITSSSKPAPDKDHFDAPDNNGGPFGADSNGGCGHVEARGWHLQAHGACQDWGFGTCTVNASASQTWAETWEEGSVQTGVMTLEEASCSFTGTITTSEPASAWSYVSFWISLTLTCTIYAGQTLTAFAAEDHIVAFDGSSPFGDANSWPAMSVSGDTLQWASVTTGTIEVYSDGVWTDQEDAALDVSGSIPAKISLTASEH